MTALGPVLTGSRVLVTAQRRADDFALALERRGADVAIAPALGMESRIDEHTLLAQTRQVIDLHADIVVITTGIGFRGWLETAEVAGLGHDLLTALERRGWLSRTEGTRCPAAAGLTPDWVAESETSAKIADFLVTEGVRGRMIAVQHQVPATTAWSRDSPRRGRRRSRWSCTSGVRRPIRRRWRCPSATRRTERSTLSPSRPRPVLPRGWRRCRSPGWGRDPPARQGRPTDPRRRRSGDRRAAPRRRIDPLVPERARLGALVRLIVMRLGDDSTSVPTPAATRVRATSATVDHDVLPLSPGALAILRELAREPGRVRSREHLLAVMPGESDDPHAAEVAVARLRDVVGRDVVRTVVKRGYALEVARPGEAHDAAMTPRLVAVSHGTSSPAGQTAVAGLVDAVRHRLPGVDVSEAFVDVQEP